MSILHIKLSKKDENLKEVIDILSGEETPFELPKMFNLCQWPKNEKELSRRAVILLLAGLEHLTEKYPKIKADERIGATSKEPEKKEIAIDKSWS